MSARLPDLTADPKRHADASRDAARADRGTAVDAARRSPVHLLVLSLALVLATIACFGGYSIWKVQRLREEQTLISERNRRDALQLLRIQNDLGSLGFLMRDMVDRVEPYPMQDYYPAFDRLKRELNEAIAEERALAPAQGTERQQAQLEQVVDSFWATVERVFARARTGDEDAAAALVTGELTQQHRQLVGFVARALVLNNQVQEEAVQAHRAIFDRVVREILLLVAMLLASVCAGGWWIIRSTRRAFDEIAQLTNQLRALGWRTLRVQEDLQRSISRDLHDDFGQILAAVGTRLGRAARRVGTEDPLHVDLDEVRQIVQETLDRIRSRSQWLHPGVLDDFGLDNALERFVDQFQRQTGIETRYDSAGPIDAIRDDYAIHVYRIVQESLSNVSRHSGSRQAWVRLRGDEDGLAIEVEDRGVGMTGAATLRPDGGMGLLNMRERAELMGGQLVLRQPAQGGLAVHAHVPDWRKPSGAPAEVRE